MTLTDEGTVLGDDENVDEELLESESYVALPDSFEIDEWSLMEQFSREHRDRAREELLDAIRGRDAFRWFKGDGAPPVNRRDRSAARKSVRVRQPLEEGDIFGIAGKRPRLSCDALQTQQIGRRCHIEAMRANRHARRIAGNLIG